MPELPDSLWAKVIAGLGIYRNGPFVRITISPRRYIIAAHSGEVTTLNMGGFELKPFRTLQALTKPLTYMESIEFLNYMQSLGGAK